MSKDYQQDSSNAQNIHTTTKHSKNCQEIVHEITVQENSPENRPVHKSTHKNCPNRLDNKRQKSTKSMHQLQCEKSKRFSSVTIELLNNKLHGLSTPGGLVSPPQYAKARSE